MTIVTESGAGEDEGRRLIVCRAYRDGAIMILL
jgi:hypothetical protein